MFWAQLAHTTDALSRAFITDAAGQSIGTVGRNDRNATTAQNIRRLFDQTVLGIIRVYLKKLAHIGSLADYSGYDQAVHTGVMSFGKSGITPRSSPKRFGP